MSSGSGKFTALYWALTGGKKVGDHMVEFLISRGGEFDALPAYYSGGYEHGCLRLSNSLS
jgi:hypothetical protein